MGIHHVDKETIPGNIIELEKRHGRVKRGTLLGRIYAAPKFDASIPPHVHLNIIDRNGYYQNLLRFFPPLADKTLPKIRRIYVVDVNNRVVAQIEPHSKLSTIFSAGKYVLVLDILDIIDGAPKRDSIGYLTISANGKSIGTMDFLDHLPKKVF